MAESEMRWLVPKKFDFFDSRGPFGTVSLLHTHTQVEDGYRSVVSVVVKRTHMH